MVDIDDNADKLYFRGNKDDIAYVEVKLFGRADASHYNSMTEKQQFTLGAYVNLMNASVQLLVNPIMGLQPKYTPQHLKNFLTYNVNYAAKEHCRKNKDLIVYMANLLFKIKTEESDRKLLSKSFRGNKEFRKKMKLKKSDLNLELFNIVNKALEEFR